MDAAAPAPAQTFARLIAGLCRAVAVAAAKNPLAAPLLLLLWPRLHRLSRRIAALAARIEAGTAGRRPPSPRPAAPRPRPPYARLPRRFAWLPRLVPEAAASGSQLQHLLAEPQTAALLAAPQMGRLLRPLCRMLGVRPPPALTLPPTPSRRTATRRALPIAPSPDPRHPRSVPARRARPRACGPPVAG